METDVITKKECKHKQDVLECEIEALQSLIDRRWMWLNKAENKLRGTYKAVLKDTNEMEAKLKDLKAGLEVTTETQSEL